MRGEACDGAPHELDPKDVAEYDALLAPSRAIRVGRHRLQSLRAESLGADST